MRFFRGWQLRVGLPATCQSQLRLSLYGKAPLQTGERQAA